MKSLAALCVVVLAVCAMPAAGQDPAPGQDEADGQAELAAARFPDLPVIAADQLVLDYLALPDGMDREMLQSLMRLQRREILVRNIDGSVRGPLANCQEADPGMMVYDTADYVKAVRAALAKVVSQAPIVVDQVLQTEVYVPRFVEVSRLANLLEPLRRTVATRASPHQPWEQHSNYTFQSSPAMIVMNDTKDQVTRMIELLVKMDQAPPQMLITCWLVRGTFDKQEGRDLPSDLVDNLRRLLPYHEYGLVTTALVRTSIVAGMERSLRGTFESNGEFDLTLRPGAVDTAGRRLAFERIEFKSAGEAQFDTSAVVAFDEYTVLGAAGANPLLVVLQVKPVQD